MSAEPQQVRVHTLSGELRVGTVIDERWRPAFNAQDRDVVRVDVDGTVIKTDACEVEEL